MEKRSTMHMIEPEIYVTYMLILKHGISPQRALDMWANNRTWGSPKEDIKKIIGWRLQQYWESHHLKNISQKSGSSHWRKADSVIKFLKKYENSPGFFKRISRLLGIG